ncbi:MAG: 2-C-methyl-D-erythritol 2,4-cyclodiphosphate synthase [Dysosmobacter sp.]
MGGINKLLEPLDGIPVLVRTLTALERAQRVDSIVIATREEDLITVSQLCKTYGITKCKKVIGGGEDREHSVLLAALEAEPDTELLAVQDGARPLVSPVLIDRVIEAAQRCGAAAPAIPVKDTIKTVREDGAVEETLERSRLRAVQTPQVFEASLLKAALQAALEEGAVLTDDCSAVERLGKVVYLIEGGGDQSKNHHAYRPDFGGGAAGSGGGCVMTPLRIGHGYDVHQLTERRKLILGGVEIPYERGLLGHLLTRTCWIHAVMDALTGAARLGDIGQLFPDTDPAYAGASSLGLLAQVGRLLREKGYAVVNIDATLIAQAPKVGPYKQQMARNLAQALGISLSRSMSRPPPRSIWVLPGTAPVWPLMPWFWWSK